jgi:hypothetical protein
MLLSVAQPLDAFMAAIDAELAAKNTIALGHPPVRPIIPF